MKHLLADSPATYTIICWRGRQMHHYKRTLLVVLVSFLVLGLFSQNWVWLPAASKDFRQLVRVQSPPLVHSDNSTTNSSISSSESVASVQRHNFTVTNGSSTEHITSFPSVLSTPNKSRKPAQNGKPSSRVLLTKILVTVGSDRLSDRNGGHDGSGNGRAAVPVDITNVSAADRAICVGAEANSAEVEDVLCWPKPKFETDMKNPCWWQEDMGYLNVKSYVGLAQRRLYCLPFFHILGTSKSGTTDLFHRISLHPEVVLNTGIFGKEQLYWSWSKYSYGYRGRGQMNTPFQNYIRGFNPLARRLQNAGKYDKSHLVTLDGSPPDMWDFRGWWLLPQNRGLRVPAVLTPHLMRYVYRDPKFVVMLREPVERLYTAYFFHQMGYSAQSFHRDVTQGLTKFNACLQSAPNRKECYYNASVIDDMKAKLDKMLSAPVSYHTELKDVAGPMLNATRDLLRRYVEPCNQELADLLEDDQFLWKDVYGA